MRVFDGKPGPPAGRPWVSGWREGAHLNCQSARRSGLRGMGSGVWEWALRGGGLLMHSVWSGPVVGLAEEVSGRRRYCAVLKELFRRFI